MWPRLTSSDLELCQPFSSQRAEHLRSQQSCAGFVYFDAGNVILDLDWDSYFEAMAGLVDNRVAQFTMENFVKSMMRSGLARQWSCGEIGNALFAAGMKELLSKEFGTAPERASAIFPQTLKVISSLVVGPPRQRVFELIKQLKKRGFMIGLCSNCNPWHEIDIERNRTLYDLFDVVIYSHDVKCEKPERAIYEVATKMATTFAHARQCDLTTQDIYFVDDLPINVKEARAYGWNASLVCLVRPEILERVEAKMMSASEFEMVSARASSLLFGDAAARRVQSLFARLV